MSLGVFYEAIAQPLRVETGRNLTFPMHLHKQAELVFVEKGCLCVMVEGERRALGAGDAALVWPGSAHGYEAQGDTAQILAIADLSLLGDDRQSLTAFACASPFLTGDAVHPDVRRCLQTLARGGDLSASLKRAYVQVAFGRVLEALPLTPQRGLNGQDALHSLLTYIGAHITEPLSLEGLSKALYLNPYTISKLFARRIRCSLHGYVNALRVDMAERMLRDTSLDVPQIAARCGFGSERTFYRAFRQHHGLTPAQYRRARGL